jgi:hypothetical protein
MTNYEKYSKDLNTLSEFIGSVLTSCEEENCDDCRFGKFKWCPHMDIESFLNEESNDITN